MRTFSRSSGTATREVFGSMVQKGKLAACAFALSDRALNSVLCRHQQELHFDAPCIR